MNWKTDFTPNALKYFCSELAVRCPTNVGVIGFAEKRGAKRIVTEGELFAYDDLVMPDKQGDVGIYLEVCPRRSDVPLDTDGHVLCLTGSLNAWLGFAVILRMQKPDADDLIDTIFAWLDLEESGSIAATRVFFK